MGRASVLGAGWRTNVAGQHRFFVDVVVRPSDNAFRAAARGAYAVEARRIIHHQVERVVTTTLSDHAIQRLLEEDGAPRATDALAEDAVREATCRALSLGEMVEHGASLATTTDFDNLLLPYETDRFDASFDMREQYGVPCGRVTLGDYRSEIERSLREHALNVFGLALDGVADHGNLAALNGALMAAKRALSAPQEARVQHHISGRFNKDTGLGHV